MHVTAVEHLLPQPIVEQQLVIALAEEIEAADGHDDLAIFVIGVDQVGRGVAERVVVGNALDDPIGVEAVAAGGGVLGGEQIGLVDGEDEAAEAGDGGELVGGGGGPALAVVGADVGAALPCPAEAAQNDDAFDAASYRHFILMEE